MVINLVMFGIYQYFVFLQVVVGVVDVEVCPLCIVLYNITICGTK